MHNPFFLAQHIEDNFSFVLSYAFSDNGIRAAGQDRYQGQRDHFTRLALKTPERRADRALLEMAAQMRALDDLSDINGRFKDQERGAIGHVVNGDGAREDLYFRDMTNKIMHANGFSWELARPEDPVIVCLAGGRWKEAHIHIIALLDYVVEISSWPREPQQA